LKEPFQESSPPKALSYEEALQQARATHTGPHWQALYVSVEKIYRQYLAWFTEAHANELTEAIEDFTKNRISRVVEGVAKRTSKKVLRELKSRWPEEQAQQEFDLAGFRERLEERWGKPLGQLRMLLTMVREWTGNAHERESTRRKHKNKQLRQILIRLLARGCQVTDEIICLLENGFSDGAMARWRTLHEIAVVAAVISQHGAPLAERYIDHQAVESKRAMEKYLLCY
jgi:Family of unknown function (DUF5677)